ncbi:MAG: hypothetical protein P8X91_02765 [Candidatus Bathyarchaeota archaeon]|jgi:hypothetical protein
MNKKIGFLIATNLFLVSALMVAPIAFAQPPLWNVVLVSAYVTDFDDSGSSISFTVAALPSGSTLTNTIYVEHTGADNYTTNLVPGDRLSVNYSGGDVITMNVVAASEPNYFEVTYSGESRSVQLNSAYIPEFPPILAIPLFLVVTLLALVLRRKHFLNKTD